MMVMMMVMTIIVMVNFDGDDKSGLKQNVTV